MEVFYKSEIGLKYLDRQVFKPSQINWCCEAMYEVYTNKMVIKFGEMDGLLNTNTDVNIYECSCWGGEMFYDPYKINFCPFCGAKITVTEDVITSPESV